MAFETRAKPEPQSFSRTADALGGTAITGGIDYSYRGFCPEPCAAIVTRALTELYPDETFVQSDYARLHQYGMHAIENGTLHGTPALCVLETSTKRGFFAEYQAQDRREVVEKAEQNGPVFLFHGTFQEPGIMRSGIEPRTGMRLRAPGVFETEPARSSQSYGSTYFPIIRSLLHQDSPALQGIDSLILFRLKNMHGLALTVTVKKAVDRLHNARGWVYASRANGVRFEPADTYEDQQEVRLYDALQYHYAIRTSVHDLPGNLIVLDGEGDALWEFKFRMNQEASWRQLARKLGLGGYLLRDLVEANHCHHATVLNETFRTRIPSPTDPTMITGIEYAPWPFYRAYRKLVQRSGTGERRMVLPRLWRFAPPFLDPGHEAGIPTQIPRKIQQSGAEGK